MTLHHITSPFFIRQDLQDSLVGANFVEAHFGTASDYATGVETTLRNLPVAEEPRGGTTDALDRSAPRTKGSRTTARSSRRAWSA